MFFFLFSLKKKIPFFYFYTKTCIFNIKFHSFHNQPPCSGIRTYFSETLSFIYEYMCAQLALNLKKIIKWSWWLRPWSHFSGDKTNLSNVDIIKVWGLHGYRIFSLKMHNPETIALVLGFFIIYRLKWYLRLSIYVERYFCHPYLHVLLHLLLLVSKLSKGINY